MMNIEQILMLESSNHDCVHLHFCLQDNYWIAYEKSAINLLEIIPQLQLKEKVFSDYEVCLRYTIISSEQIGQYGLANMCTQLSDEYIKLHPTCLKQKEIFNTKIDFTL